MATPLVLTGCRIFAGGVDLTGYSNKLEISPEIEERETTTFASQGWKECIGGIASAKVVGGGNWQAGDSSIVDDGVWASLGAVVPYSAFPIDANEASTGYFTKVLGKSYQFFGGVGDVASWTIDDESAWPAVRGQSLHAPGTARIASGSGTAVQLGAVASNRKLYAALHVLSVSGTGGPTLTVKVQSDNGAGFATPADQITFTAATAISSQISRVAGPITDDWFRVDYTITGSTPSFLFIVVAGIAV